MTVMIADGLTLETARVVDNRLETSAVTTSGPVDAALKGDIYFISTGVVNLTGSGDSFLFYVKNEEVVGLIVDSITATFGATDGVGDSFVKIVIQPTGGTLLTTAVDGLGGNLNIGSPKPLEATVKIGSQDDTVEGGSPPINTLIPSGVDFRRFAAEPIIIAPNTGFAMGIQPPAGNTSMNVALQMIAYRA